MHQTHQWFRNLAESPGAIVARNGAVLVTAGDGTDTVTLSLPRWQAEELLASLETALEQLEHENGAKPVEA